jgi:2-polyprenyl-3-methyl-5-hydroxy-6-metoxy-1,4-benzoquinol methylase
MEDLTRDAATKLSKDRDVCPHCGNSSALFRSSTDINNSVTCEVFHYYRCSRCDLVFMSNIPPDMSPYYRKGYQAIPRSVAELRKLADREKYRLNELLKLKTGGRLLEVGPWIGIFSINAKDAGFEVDAIESDTACVEFLTNVAGVNVFESNNPADTLASMTQRYDAVVLWHSLEHLPTPWLVIERASKVLNPGGILLVAIPNIDSYDSCVMREKWVHLDTPRHLYFYAPQALTALCRRFLLSPVHMATHDRLSLILGLQAWYRYLRRCQPLKYLSDLAGMVRGLVRLPSSTPKKTFFLGSGFTAIFMKSELRGKE